MEKRVYLCDICDKELDPYDKISFKVKEKVLGSHWYKIDLCYDCYKKLVEITLEKELEKSMLDNALKRYEILYPGDENIDLQQAYLTGAQDAIDMLLINRVNKKE